MRQRFFNFLILLSFALRLIFAHRTLPASLPGRAWIPPVLLAAGMAAMTLPDELRYSLGTLALAAGVNSLELSRGWYRRLLELPLIGWIGTMSFSLYIWQQPFYGMHRNGVATWLCLGLAAACGMWSYYAVERPARRWLNTRMPRWRFARGDRATTVPANAPKSVSTPS